jgi:hypothetical protein
VEKKNMSINEYSLKIKGIVESLASINVSVDDDDLVSVCLNGLGKEYKPFKTSIIVRENVPNFRDLVSMLIVEEKTLNEDCSTQNKNNVKQQTFYSNTSRSRGRGCGRGQGGGRFGNQNFGQQRSNDSQQQQSYKGGGRGQSQSKGGQRGRGNWNRQQSGSNSRGCHYCGKPGHWAKECRKKESDMRNGRLQQNNYASSSKHAEDRYEHLFVV